MYVLNVCMLVYTYVCVCMGECAGPNARPLASNIHTYAGCGRAGTSPYKPGEADPLK